MSDAVLELVVVQFGGVISGGGEVVRDVEEPPEAGTVRLVPPKQGFMKDCINKASNSTVSQVFQSARSIPPLSQVTVQRTAWRRCKGFGTPSPIVITPLQG